MKILHISDTHQNFPKDLPKADVIVHTGDYSFLSKRASDFDKRKELKEFNEYLGSIKDNYEVIIFTPGNHDFIFEDNFKLAKEYLSNAIVLVGDSYVHNGIKFYGEPSQPIFFNWAFNDDDKLRDTKYKAIPEDTDVLLTHCPPHEILDLVSNKSYSAGQHVGCSILRYQVETRIKPKLHCFGHIHDQKVTIKVKDGIIYSNACIMDDDYKPNGNYNLLEIE